VGQFLRIRPTRTLSDLMLSAGAASVVVPSGRPGLALLDLLAAPATDRTRTSDGPIEKAQTFV
jgi:hypothetical protein